MRIAFLILVAVFSGCASPRQKASADIPLATAAAMKRLYVGMPDSQALEVMKPVSLNWGRAIAGGTGAGVLIFQISDTKQVRVEFELKSAPGFEIGEDAVYFLSRNLDPQFVVSRIGEPEQKTVWALDANHYFTK